MKTYNPETIPKQRPQFHQDNLSKWRQPNWTPKRSRKKIAIVTPFKRRKNFYKYLAASNTRNIFLSFIRIFTIGRFWHRLLFRKTAWKRQRRGPGKGDPLSNQNFVSQMLAQLHGPPAQLHRLSGHHTPRGLLHWRAPVGS